MRRQLKECFLLQLTCLLENRNGSYQLQSEGLFAESRTTHEFSACSRNVPGTENLPALQVVLNSSWNSVSQNHSWTLDGITFEVHSLKWPKSFTLISFLALRLKCKLLWVTNYMILFVYRDYSTFGFLSNLLETFHFQII